MAGSVEPVKPAPTEPLKMHLKWFFCVISIVTKNDWDKITLIDRNKPYCMVWKWMKYCKNVLLLSYLKESSNSMDWISKRNENQA